MSKKHYNACGCGIQTPNYAFNNFGGYGRGNCCCNFPSLIILILIVLQFGRNENNYRGSRIDNGVLFIIALYFLSCCNPCRV